MKYFKTFEGFKKEYMTKIDLKDFKKIKKGTKLTYMGGPAEVMDNNGYVLTLKGEDDKTFTVNKSQFDHGGFIKESVNEAQFKVGDNVIVMRKDGKEYTGKVEKLNPLKLRISPSDTMVIPNAYIKDIVVTEEYDVSGISREDLKHALNYLDMKDISYDFDGKAEILDFDMTELDKKGQAELKKLGINESVVNEAKKFKPGDKWSEDFDYDGMLAYALKVNEKTPLKTLQKLHDSATDVNYHTPFSGLGNAIDWITDDGVNSPEGKDFIKQFHNDIKTEMKN